MAQKSPQLLAYDKDRKHTERILRGLDLREIGLGKERLSLLWDVDAIGWEPPEKAPEFTPPTFPSQKDQSLGQRIKTPEFQELVERFAPQVGETEAGARYLAILKRRINGETLPEIAATEPRKDKRKDKPLTTESIRLLSVRAAVAVDRWQQRHHVVTRAKRQLERTASARGSDARHR